MEDQAHLFDDSFSILRLAFVSLSVGTNASFFTTGEL